MSMMYVMMAPDSHKIIPVFGSSIAWLVSRMITYRRSENIISIELTRYRSIWVEIDERWLLDIIKTEGRNLVVHLELVEDENNLP